MELFATGFNAWNQLCFDYGREGSHDDSEPEDFRRFTSVLTDERIDQVESFLSYTRVRSTPSGLRSAGAVPRGHEALRTTSKFGESNLFAEASNGVVVVYNKATKTITQYPSLQHLILENDRESNPNSSWSFTPPPDSDTGHTAEIIQLVSYETGFAALSSSGTVFAWGDERYSACLGREVTDETPASRPHPVTALENLPTGKITKIVAGVGGTILAALTKGQDLYAWGQPPRYEPFRASCSHRRLHPYSNNKSNSASEEAEAEAETPFFTTLTIDPIPVDINNWRDIADIAIGERHLLALTTEGQVFAIGDNTNGQLGLPDIKYSTNVWTKVNVDIGEGAVTTGVVAGPRNSFVIVRRKTNTK